MSPQHIYQFELNVETGVLGSLKALDATLPAYKRLDNTASLPRTYLVVEASPFTPASDHMAFAQDGTPFRCHYSGQVAIHIQTPRDAGATAEAYHHALVALVRRVLGTPLSLQLPPYGILDIKEGGGSITFQKDGDRDRSELNFDLQLGIPSGLLDYSAPTTLPPIPPEPTVV